MKATIQFALRGYKRWISPLLPHACRFVPTCSEYALEAVDLHGPLRGCWLAIARLLRCHPFALAGYDPVPQDTRSVSHCCDYLASAPAGAHPKPLNRH